MRIMRKIAEKKKKKRQNINDEATDHPITQRLKIIRSFTTRQDISSQIYDKVSLQKKNSSYITVATAVTLIFKTCKNDAKA